MHTPDSTTEEELDKRVAEATFVRAGPDANVRDGAQPHGCQLTLSIYMYIHIHMHGRQLTLSRSHSHTHIHI